jgi:hypothetical protein
MQNALPPNGFTWRARRDSNPQRSDPYEPDICSLLPVMSQSGGIVSSLFVLFGVGLLWLVGGLVRLGRPANEGQCRTSGGAHAGSVAVVHVRRRTSEHHRSTVALGNGLCGSVAWPQTLVPIVHNAQRLFRQPSVEPTFVDGARCPDAHSLSQGIVASRKVTSCRRYDAAVRPCMDEPGGLPGRLLCAHQAAPRRSCSRCR